MVCPPSDSDPERGCANPFFITSHPCSEPRDALEDVANHAPIFLELGKPRAKMPSLKCAWHFVDSKGVEERERRQKENQLSVQMYVT